MDLADPAHHLPDALGERAGEPDPLLLPRVELALQLRDEPHLHRVQRDGGHSEDRVLDEHEDQQGDEHPALERGQGDGVADVAAEGVGLGDDGGDQLALRGPAEPRQREAQHAHEEVVAQAPEHALADDPAVDVEEVLEAAVDEDEREEYRAQDEEVLDLPERDAEDLGRERGRVGVDRLVDDQLRQVEQEVEERKRGNGQREQKNLLAEAVPEHELEDGRFHVRFPGELRGVPRLIAHGYAGEQRRASAPAGTFPGASRDAGDPGFLERGAGKAFAQAGWGADEPHRAVMQHAHPVAQAARVREQVSAEKHRRAAVAQRAEMAPREHPRLRVEAAHRFVEHEQGLVREQAGREPELLRRALRVVADRLVQGGRLQVERGEHLAHPVGTRGDGVHPRHEAEELPPVQVTRGHESLGQVGERAPRLRRGRGPAEDADPTRVEVAQIEQALHAGGLAGAVGSDQAEDLSRAHLQREPLQHRAGSEPFGHGGEFNGVRAGRRASRLRRCAPHVRRAAQMSPRAAAVTMNTLLIATIPAP